eukprot:10753980-Alexandrium_andersonii.AAC.1
MAEQPLRAVAKVSRDAFNAEPQDLARAMAEHSIIRLGDKTSTTRTLVDVNAVRVESLINILRDKP